VGDISICSRFLHPQRLHQSDRDHVFFYQPLISGILLRYLGCLLLVPSQNKLHIANIFDLCDVLWNGMIIKVTEYNFVTESRKNSIALNCFFSYVNPWSQSETTIVLYSHDCYHNGYVWSLLDILYNCFWPVFLTSICAQNPSSCHRLLPCLFPSTKRLSLDCRINRWASPS
jgi:hypothetical protein